MSQILVVRGKKADDHPASTRWKKFKDIIHNAKCYLQKRRENVIKKAMEHGNTGKVLRLLNRINDESKKDCIDYLEKENTKYSYSDCKRIYVMAKQEGGAYPDLVVKVYKKLNENEKSKFLSIINKEIEEKLRYLKWSGIVDESFKTVMKIYGEIGNSDESTNLTKYWDILRDIVYGGSKNSLSVRMFALDVLYASNYGSIEFWKSVVAVNGNGDQHELAKYGLKLLLRKETEGSEQFFLENLDGVAKKLVEVSCMPELGREEKKRLLSFIASTLCNGSDEQKLALLGALNSSKKLHAGLRDSKMVEAILKILNRYNKTYLDEFSRLEEGLKAAKKKRENVKEELFFSIDEFISKVEKELDKYRLTEELVLAALLFLSRIQWCPEELKNRLFDLLKIGSENDKIVKRIAKALRYSKISNSEINEIPLKKMITALLDSAYIDDNIAAGEILIMLQGSEEAKRLIREAAIPELKDLIDDEKLDKKKKENIINILEQLKKMNATAGI